MLVNNITSNAAYRQSFRAGANALGLKRTFEPISTTTSIVDVEPDAEMTLVRDNADQSRNAFPLRMTRGSDGVWRIAGM